MNLFAPTTKLSDTSSFPLILVSPLAEKTLNLSVFTIKSFPTLRVPERVVSPESFASPIIPPVTLSVPTIAVFPLTSRLPLTSSLPLTSRLPLTLVSPLADTTLNLFAPTTKLSDTSSLPLSLVLPLTSSVPFTAIAVPDMSIFLPRTLISPPSSSFFSLSRKGNFTSLILLESITNNALLLSRLQNATDARLVKDTSAPLLYSSILPCPATTSETDSPGLVIRIR